MSLKSKIRLFYGGYSYSYGFCSMYRNELQFYGILTIVENGDEVIFFVFKIKLNCYQF